MEKDELKRKLNSLYNDSSKHSNYQNIPGFVSEALDYNAVINEEWRGDTSRYKYLLNELYLIDGYKVCDLGANTGFFSLSLSGKFPNIKVTALEGNENHVDFIQTVKDYFGINNLMIERAYVDFDGLEKLQSYDIMLNLNVLHHAGVDFDKQLVSLNTFTEYAVKYFEKLRTVTHTMIFQMGFNHGGNKKTPIVELSNDIGKFLFVCNICRKSGWEPINVAYINRDNEGKLEYKNAPIQLVEDVWKSGNTISEFEEYINQLNLASYSEFYRRPIFVLERSEK